MALTYRHTADFAAAYAGVLPEEAQKVVSRYLALEKKPKLVRMLGMERGDYRMQSFITRAGQLFFC